MSLGRVYPGRLPTTQADLTAIENRIKFVERQMKDLDRRQRQGGMDPRQAMYLRHQLAGEINDLRSNLARYRLSTPSYKVPRDLQVYQRKTETTGDGYFGDDYARRGATRTGLKDNYPTGVFFTDTRISTDWEATDPTDFRVPGVNTSPGFSRGMWPDHWPGNHSSMINYAVMDAGQFNGKQIVDPREPGFKITLNLKDANNRNIATQVVAKYYALLGIVEGNPVYSPTDYTLVSMIYTSVKSQLDDAKASAGEATFTPSTGNDDPYPGQEDTGSGDNSTETEFKYSDDAFMSIIDDIVKVNNKVIISANLQEGSWYAGPGFSSATYLEKQQVVTGFNNLLNVSERLTETQYNLVEAALTFLANASVEAVEIQEETPVLDSNGKYTDQHFNDVIVDDILTVNGKVYISYVNGAWQTNVAQPITSEVEALVISLTNAVENPERFTETQLSFLTSALEYASLLFEQSINGIAGFRPKKLPGILGRRTGTSMQLGAMQNHERLRELKLRAGQPVTAAQRQTMIAQQRGVTMRKAQIGAQIDLSKPIKEGQVARPWTLQVGMPLGNVQTMQSQIEVALSQMGLSQAMFTQDGHNYVANVINSMPSGMTLGQQTEFVIGRVMSEMANRSALLTRNVKVDVNGNKDQAISFTEVSGLSGGFLKTKAALGRLLG